MVFVIQEMPKVEITSRAEVFISQSMKVWIMSGNYKRDRKYKVKVVQSG